MIISPCISICKTDPLTGFCYGCGRSNNDKKIWKDEKTSDDWKKNNLLELEKFNNIKISSFGTFKVSQKKERIGRNPHTKVEAKITARKVVKFRPSIQITKKINNQ